MTFLKENLLGDSYEWTTDGAGKTITDAVPTRNRFDRFNGNSVLRMINLYSRLVGVLSVRNGQEVEELISKELPLTLSSEVSVFNWLKGRLEFSTAERRFN